MISKRFVRLVGKARQHGGVDRIARVAPVFQTGDSRYAWLNDIQGVAIGVPGDGEVTYEVYALE